MPVPKNESPLLKAARLAQRADDLRAKASLTRVCGARKKDKHLVQKTEQDFIDRGILLDHTAARKQAEEAMKPAPLMLQDGSDGEGGDTQKGNVAASSDDVRGLSCCQGECAAKTSAPLHSG